MIVHERIYKTLLDSAAGAAVWHGFTNTGNPACCAAGLKTLEIMERDGVVENSRKMGERLNQRLQELRSSPIVGEIRGLGLMAGVELVRNPQTREAFPGCARRRRSLARRGARGGAAGPRGRRYRLHVASADHNGQGNRSADR